MKRNLVLPIAAAMSLGACATPGHTVTERGDPLAAPHGSETLSQDMVAQSVDRGGCLAPGNAGDRRDSCEALRDLIAPPPPPPPLPPPPPQAPFEPGNRESGYQR